MTTTRERAARAALLAAACVVLCASCGTDAAGSDPFVPAISQITWHNQADANDQFFFLPEADGARISPFSGDENNETTGALLSFTGSYSDRSITLTYDPDAGDKAGQTYTGTVDGASDRISLNGAAGRLVLVK
jgi:hypothetical protein